MFVALSLAIASLQVIPGGNLDLSTAAFLGGGFVNARATAHAVVVDAGTRYCAAAKYTSQFTGGVETVRVDSSGVVVWSAEQTFVGYTRFEAVGALAASDGGVIVVSQGTAQVPGLGGLATDLFVRRYSPAGVLVWETEIDPDAPSVANNTISMNGRCVLSDGAGGVYIGGVRLGTGVGVRATIFHVDAAGVEQPDILPLGSTPGQIFAMVELPGGGYCVASGSTLGNDVARLDDQFASVWQRSYGTAFPEIAPQTTTNWVQRLAVDGLGNLYAGFGSNGAEARLASLDLGNGDLQWLRTATDPVSSSNAIGALVGVDSGGVLVVSSGDDGLILGRSVTPDGATISSELDWQADVPSDSSVAGATLDAQGHLFVWGQVREGGFGSPVATLNSEFGYLAEFVPVDEIGSRYCSPIQPNSTGEFGQIQAFGSLDVALNNVALQARGLPALQFGLFVAGETRGVTPLGGSSAALCIEGQLGRYMDSLQQTTIAGTLSHRIDTGAIPTPTALLAATAGLEWHFQCWHRDSQGGSPSNTTNAVTLAFQ